MARSVKKEAKTAEEAIRLALEELKLTRNDVRIYVLEEGKSGILGFGSRNALVEVIELEYEESDEEVDEDDLPETDDDYQDDDTVDAEDEEVSEYIPDPELAAAREGMIRGFLEPVFEKMEITPEYEFVHTEGHLTLRLTGENVGIVIGRRGETLDALQYLVSLVVNRHSDEYTRVVLDVSDYRMKREETLRRLARRVADKVSKTRRSITLEPMNPYERRIIHSSLQSHRWVETHSIGEEPNRKVVVRFKGSSGNSRSY